jgi:dTDP-4-amino-4,6-dideoxy-D-galactose acyltransferase
MKIVTWDSLSFLARFFPGFFSSPSLPGNQIFCRKLDWDSAFFKAPVYKLEYLPENSTEAGLIEVLPAGEGKRSLVFAEAPAQATRAIQTLCRTGFSMMETRLTYFHNLQHIPETTNKARAAITADIPHLKKTASAARNDFDRYHTDPFFSNEQAEYYLETYIENCMKGLSEFVLVPDLSDPPASFAAFSRVQHPNLKSEQKLYRIPLTACLEENRGWHYHLCLSALHKAVEAGAFALVMTTQAGNQAVIHNCEKLGFKLGSVTHIFSKTLT